MTEITTRLLNQDELLDAVYPIHEYAFASSPPLPDAEEWQATWERRAGSYFLGLSEDGRPVACVGGTALTQNVRGKLFDMGGVFAVATDLAARRKGYSRQLLTEQMAMMRDRGEVFSCLYPFRESFYQRLGYVTFPQYRAAHFPPGRLASLAGMDVSAYIEVMTIAEGYADYRDYLRVLLPLNHGMAMFTEEQTEAVAARNAAWLAIARVDGEIVGMMGYTLKGERPMEFHMRVTRFYYHTSQGKYFLLAWIGRHVDQAETVEIWLPPYETPETWLADLNLKTERPWIPAMGRVIDIAGIGGMATGPGRCSARISDPVCDWNRGDWTFETVDGQLTVSEGGTPDFALSIQGLSALAYGTHDPADFPFRGWGDPSPEVVEILRGMFSRELPYLAEFY